MTVMAPVGKPHVPFGTPEQASQKATALNLSAFCGLSDLAYG